MACRDAGVPVRCAWQVEKDPFCRAVLSKHRSGVKQYEDVRISTLDAVAVIVGGFPCQDVSVAGARAGLSGARSGLWFEYLRHIETIRPLGIIVENVTGLVRRGLDDVVTGLVGAGYAVEATRLRAEDVGAPHRRERIFLVAYAGGERREGAERGTHNAALQRSRHKNENAAQPVVGGGSHGCAKWLDGVRWPAPPGPAHDWEPPRTKTGVVNRPAKLRALGNAVVPQCAYIAGMRLLDRLGINNGIYPDPSTGTEALF